jgi:ATP-dependent protease HslVU (ClpYQ) peptidase subunit
MTAIAALEYPGGVVVGSDSCVSFEDYFHVDDAPKYFRHGDAIVALAGSLRAGLVAEMMPALRAPRRDERDAVYLAAVVGEALRQTFAATETPHKDVSGLIVWRGAVWVLDTEFGVSRPATGYAAAGSAELLALGALAATPHLAPRARVETALRVAADHCVGVRAPFHVLDVVSRKRRRAP